MIIQEIHRQKNRQIARTLDDLKDLKLPEIVEKRIKRGFYDMAENLDKFLQEHQGDKSVQQIIHNSQR